jgi:ABC-2 type transport system permease protein
MLATKALDDWQIVTGKFLACWTLVIIALLVTLPYYITVAQLGNIDHGATVGGYLGLLLVSAAYTGIGLFTSSLTNNQIVAVLLALFIGIFFQFLFGLFANTLSGTIGHLFHYLNFNTHYDAISRGVIDSKNIIYLLSIAFLGIFAAQTVLVKRHYTG